MDELLNETLFRSPDHAREAVARRAADYDHRRPHSAIGYVTPARFAARITATGDPPRGLQGSTRSRPADLHPHGRAKPDVRLPPLVDEGQGSRHSKVYSTSPPWHIATPFRGGASTPSVSELGPMRDGPGTKGDARFAAELGRQAFPRTARPSAHPVRRKVPPQLLGHALAAVDEPLDRLLTDPGPCAFHPLPACDLLGGPARLDPLDRAFPEGCMAHELPLSRSPVRRPRPRGPREVGDNLRHVPVDEVVALQPAEDRRSVSA